MPRFFVECGRCLDQARMSYALGEKIKDPALCLGYANHPFLGEETSRGSGFLPGPPQGGRPCVSTCISTPAPAPPVAPSIPRPPGGGSPSRIGWHLSHGTPKSVVSRKVEERSRTGGILIFQGNEITTNQGDILVFGDRGGKGGGADPGPVPRGTGAEG